LPNKANSKSPGICFAISLFANQPPLVRLPDQKLKNINVSEKLAIGTTAFEPEKGSVKVAP
jgi:hypothetical protein